MLRRSGLQSRRQERAGGKLLSAQGRMIHVDGRVDQADGLRRLAFCRRGPPADQGLRIELRRRLRCRGREQSVRRDDMLREILAQLGDRAAEILTRRQAKRRQRAAEEIQRLPPQHPIAPGRQRLRQGRGLGDGAADHQQLVGDGGRRTRSGNRNRNSRRLRRHERRRYHCRRCGGRRHDASSGVRKCRSAGHGPAGHAVAAIRGWRGRRRRREVRTARRRLRHGRRALRVGAVIRQCQQQQSSENEDARRHGFSCSACSTISPRARNAASAWAARSG